MRESVAAVIMVGEDILMVERQDHLPSFPGYYSFPGGLIDEKDKLGEEPTGPFRKIPNHHARALVREVKEELGIDLNDEPIFRVALLGEATTPSFNPYRFKTWFILVELAAMPDRLVLDHGEIKQCLWRSPRALYERYIEGRMLAVPPTLGVLKSLSREDYWRRPSVLDFNLRYNEEREVPMIEVIKGVKQFMPLSHTFPPANRTNCFLIGERQSLLIDPSPKDHTEYQKLLRSFKPYKVDKIFISHHHADHHEYAPRMAHDLKIPLMMSEDCRQRIIEAWGRSYFLGSKIEIVHDGDYVTSWHGQEVKAYAVPGHDQGQLGLAPENNAWFFAGDLIQTVGTVVIGAPEGNMADYFRSLEKVISLNPKVVFPSHGIALGGVTKLKETLNHRKSREEQIKKLLEQTQDLEEIYSQVYIGLDPNLKRYALKTINAHIAKIRQEEQS